MTLRRRPIDPFKLVHIHDEALDPISDKIMREWADSNRQWSVIESHVKALSEKPTIYTVEPLRPEFDSLAVSGIIGDLKLIFAAHVKGIDNVPEDMRPRWVMRDDRQHLDMEYVNSIPPPVVNDIAGAIIARAMGDITPFSLPDGFWRARARRAVRRHASMVSAHTTTTVNDQGGNTENA